MNQKEVNEIRRRWSVGKCAVSRIYGCYVNSCRKIVSYIDEPTSMMGEEEAEKYLSLLKKTLSGSLGRNLIDIVFSTEQVMDSDEHRILMDLRRTELGDSEARDEFYSRVIDSLDMDDDDYLILLACDRYDVPRRQRDGADGESEDVFRYILCAVCTVKETPPRLGYFPGDNEFHYTQDRVVSAPDLGFMFPAFDDRAANIYNALYYSRSPGQLHHEFIDAVFHTEPPMTATEQKEAFETALLDSLEEDCSVEVVRSVHDGLAAKIAEHRESRAEEPLAITTREAAELLQDCGLPEERVDAFKAMCAERFGEGAVLSPGNLIDPNKFTIKTEQATIEVNGDNTWVLETRVIDGRRYILVPAGESVEVNGLTAHFASGERDGSILAADGTITLADERAANDSAGDGAADAVNVNGDVNGDADVNGAVDGDNAVNVDSADPDGDAAPNGDADGDSAVDSAADVNGSTDGDSADPEGDGDGDTPNGDSAVNSAADGAGATPEGESEAGPEERSVHRDDGVPVSGEAVNDI